MENVPKSHFELCVALEHHNSLRSYLREIIYSEQKKQKAVEIMQLTFAVQRVSIFFRNLELFAATTQMLQRLRKPVARHGKLTGFCEWLVAVWPGEPIPCC